MKNNVWAKLAAVSLGGILLSIALLWGVNQFTGHSNYNTGYNGMYMQGSTNMNGGSNSSMMDDMSEGM